ncbi:MAG TPA: hypothetical protein VH599_15510 [Ktedonobacterales bacterium]|jgi:hypothetical protein
MSILGKRALKLGLFLLGLFLAAAVYVGGGLRSYQLYQQAYASYGQGSCGAEFTWSLAPQALAADRSDRPRLLTGFYSNLPRLLTVRYRSAAPQHITLSVQIPNFSLEQPIAVDATPGWKTQDFHPPILPGVIDTLANVSYRDSQVVLRVRDASGKSCEDSKPLRLLSSRAMSWIDPQGRSDADFLAGWVTPQDPAIRQLLDRTTQRIKDNPSLYPGTTSLIGYDGSQQDVINQVNAIYDTLEQDYHIRYSRITIHYGQPQVENILLPKDLLQSGIGMCVETTLTMASAIESLHMRPFIYISASHAFLGVALGPTSTVQEFWETSLLGQHNLGRQANQQGDSEHDHGIEPITRVIDIAAERQQQNIWPME